MNFREHTELRGEHAFLSPSKYHWINKNLEDVSSAYLKFLAVQKGTELHAVACRLIELGIKLPKSKKSLNQYVNDAIGFKMKPEQALFYSPNSFGTADAISFRENLLRIHDLKTGVSPVSMNQLKVYVALFCLEYDFKPGNINIELRIYQSDEVTMEVPLPEDIVHIMDKIIVFDKEIDKIKAEELR